MISLRNSIGRAFWSGYLRGRWVRSLHADWKGIISLLPYDGFLEYGRYVLLLHDDGITYCVDRVVRWDWFGPWSRRRIA